MEAPPLPAFPMAAELEPAWAPPPTLQMWGVGVPLEAIRFAGANRLCIDLGYQGTGRRVEPYSLQCTRDGLLLLCAVRRESREPRSYRVDLIQSVRVTMESFTPVYPVEFWPTGPISAPPIVRQQSSTGGSRLRRPSRFGPRYVVQCTYCGKQFTRQDTKVRKHKMKGQPHLDCPGRVGFIVRMG